MHDPTRTYGTLSTQLIRINPQASELISVPLGSQVDACMGRAVDRIMRMIRYPQKPAVLTILFGRRRVGSVMSDLLQPYIGKSE